MRFKIGAQCALLVAAVLFAGARSAAAQAVINQEYQLKAAFIYNFGQYVTWPNGAVPGNDSTFVIGVLGRDPFGENLNRVAASKTIMKKKIVIRRFDSASQYTPCHMLFVASTGTAASAEKSAEDRVKAALEKTNGSPVLVIADSKGLAPLGASVGFFVESNKVKLEINKTAATRAGLTISSKLMALKGTVEEVKDKTALR